MPKASRKSVEKLGPAALKRACDEARKLVAAQPDDEDAAKLLAERVARFALEAPPRAGVNSDLPPALAEATQLLNAQQDEAAEVILRRYVAEHRGDVRAMAMMAEIAARCEFFEDAYKILMRALQIDPKSIDVLLALAKLLNHIAFIDISDRGEEAIEVLDRALEIDPGNISAAMLRSSILVRFRRIQESVPTYERLLDLDPLNAVAWSHFAMTLSSLGRLGEAVAALRTAAALNPRFGVAWWELANLKVSKLFESDIEQMLAVLQRPDLDGDARSHIHFALAKAYHQSRKFGEGAEHLRLGNQLKHQEWADPQHPLSVTRDVDSSRHVFTTEYFRRHADDGDPSRDPIFIIGMQRSGSTLVEQILSSHSAIEGTEELFLISRQAGKLDEAVPGQSWHLSLDQSPPEEIRAMGETFRRLSRHYRLTSRPFFIDKNPANWRYVGLIATMLPNAKIIDVRRNPMDCCFANYSQHYESGGGFSYSQTALARYYSDYVALMRHFDAAMPSKIHRVIYDDLVDDLESGVRALLSYLGLGFEESCLRFYETERVVLTPSAQQVRQPINRSGIGRWRDYEPWLGELKSALGDTLDNWRA